MPDTLTKTEDNPYSSNARLARDAERSQRIAERIAHHENYRDTMQMVAKATGTRVIAGPERSLEYSIKVPVPPIHPYHPLENPHGTRVPFDEAVKTYDELKRERDKRNKNRN